MTYPALAAKRLLLEALETPGADVRALLVMSATTVDTEPNASFLADYSNLDEMDGAGYARLGVANVVTEDDLGPSEIILRADDSVFPSLGPGTRQVAGLLYYLHVTNDADSIPLFFDDQNYPADPDGTDFRHQVSAADGIARL